MATNVCIFGFNQQENNVNERNSKNYRKPLLQRYVIRILLMYVHDPIVTSKAEHPTKQCRVPIYALSSWASMVSLKVAFWVDPIRDIYEVSITLTNNPYNTKRLLGLHDLYILSTIDKLHWWRTSTNHFDAWKRTRSPPVAAQSLSTTR